MYTLILLISLKSMYNHNIDTTVVPNLLTEPQCLSLGDVMKNDMKKINPDINVQIYCEATK